MLDEPLRILPELPVLRRVPPEQLMLEDGEADPEEDQEGSPQDAVESDEKK